MPAPDSPPGARADSLGPRFAGAPRAATCCLVVLLAAILLLAVGVVLALYLPPAPRTLITAALVLALVVHLVTP